MKSKLKPIVEIRFTGSGVSPESVPLNYLAETLSAVQKLVKGQVPIIDDEEDAGAGILRLLKINRGSARYLCTAPTEVPEAIQERLKLVDSTFSDPDLIVQHEYVLKPLATLSRVSAALQCTVEIKIPDSRELLVSVDSGTYDQVTKTIFIHGNTSITGRLEGVGGATRYTCKVRVPFQSHLFYCEVSSESVIQKMAGHLFSNVTLFGQATWFRGSWKLHRFKVEAVQDIKQMTYDDIINGFKKIGVSEEISSLNIDKFMQEQRSAG
jgi:hypothetical protein